MQEVPYVIVPSFEFPDLAGVEMIKEFLGKQIMRWFGNMERMNTE